MMIKRLTVCLMVAFLLFVYSIVVFAKNDNHKKSKIDIAQLRKLFAEATKEDFEIVKDELRSARSVAGEYWMVHVKPKRSGHFAIKYTYKYINDKFYEEGENELYIRVGGKICSRNQQVNTGIANVCLGDTVIIPIRTYNFSNHAFSLKYTNEEPQNADSVKQFSQLYEKDSKSEEIINPLSRHLKYLKSDRREQLHRNGGATIVYSATFVAIAPGRFNVGLSASFDEESTNKSVRLSQAETIPIIIVNQGTPITALVPKESTITYANKRAFSSHSGNNFLTNLLILQPGETITLEYLRTFQPKELDNKPDRLNANLKPIVYRLPFLLDENWSFNEWLADYLPAR